MENEFKIGDKVQIKSWEDMEKEFGLNPHGSIDCRYYFSVKMKYLCGKEFIIEEINGDKIQDIDDWSISFDMLKPCSKVEFSELGKEVEEFDNRIAELQKMIEELQKAKEKFIKGNEKYLDLSPYIQDGVACLWSEKKLDKLHNPQIIEVRVNGEHQYRAFWLNKKYNWELVNDEEGELCLVPTKK
jgi:hypothetical protein